MRKQILSKILIILLILLISLPMLCNISFASTIKNQKLIDIMLEYLSDDIEYKDKVSKQERTLILDGVDSIEFDSKNSKFIFKYKGLEVWDMLRACGRIKTLKII